MKVKSLSRARLLATPWTTAYQAPLSMGFSRQEYWNGLPLPSLKEALSFQYRSDGGSKGALVARYCCGLGEPFPMYPVGAKAMTRSTKYHFTPLMDKQNAEEPQNS